MPLDVIVFLLSDAPIVPLFVNSLVFTILPSIVVDEDNIVVPLLSIFPVILPFTFACAVFNTFNAFWVTVLPKVVVPDLTVVVPFEPTTVPLIVLVPVKFKALVFVIPLVNLELSIFKVPALVTADPSKP